MPESAHQLNSSELQPNIGSSQVEALNKKKKRSCHSAVSKRMYCSILVG
jgi:hypothetical protein